VCVCVWKGERGVNFETNCTLMDTVNYRDSITNTTKSTICTNDASRLELKDLSEQNKTEASFLHPSIMTETKIIFIESYAKTRYNKK